MKKRNLKEDAWTFIVVLMLIWLVIALSSCTVVHHHYHYPTPPTQTIEKTKSEKPNPTRPPGLAAKNRITKTLN